MILLLLAVWGGVGAWWFLNRPEAHSTDSIGSFRQQLRVLERTGPTTVSPAYRMHSQDLGVYGASHLPRRPLTSAPVRRRQAQKRRRDVFYGLLASIGGSLVLGFLPGLSVMWWLTGLLVLALALYVVVLMQVQAAAAERSQKVRYLQRAGRTAPGRGGPGRAWAASGYDGSGYGSAYGSGYGEVEPAYLLRRSAN